MVENRGRDDGRGDWGLRQWPRPCVEDGVQRESSVRACSSSAEVVQSMPLPGACFNAVRRGRVRRRGRGGATVQGALLIHAGMDHRDSPKGPWVGWEEEWWWWWTTGSAPIDESWPRRPRVQRMRQRQGGADDMRMRSLGGVRRLQQGWEAAQVQPKSTRRPYTPQQARPFAG